MSSSLCILSLLFTHAPHHPTSCLKSASSWLLPISHLPWSFLFSSRGSSPPQRGLKGSGGLAPLRTCSPASSPPGRTQASHTAVTCIPTQPWLQGENLALVVLQWLLPLMIPPPPSPQLLSPSSAWPMAPLHALTWVHSLPKTSMSTLIEELVKPQASPDSTWGGFYLNWFPILVPKGLGPMPYSSNAYSGASCGETPAQKNPLLTKESVVLYFHFSMW